MPFHKDYTEYNNHAPISFVFADEAARLATTNPYTGLAYTSSDLNKFAIQSDNVSTGAIYLLATTTPTWIEIAASSFDLTDGNATTANGTAVDLGGIVTGNISLSPDTDGSHDIAFGTGLSDRINSFNVAADSGAGMQAGATNDRSFVQLFGATLKGCQFGYFLNETSLMGFNINVGNDGNFEVADQINSKGMIYLADYSANYTDRSIVDKAYVDNNFQTDNIYTANGTLTGNRTVTGNSSNDLTFLHYNGTSSTYTLRSQFTLEDTDITISSHLGDGFGADIATQSLSMLNSGTEITTGIGDVEWFLSGNDCIFYEGANDTTANLLTVHGDGNHSVFDPFVTLHEGYATANGTDSQSLIMNNGKACQWQWNDGTRSVDVFHVKSVVNGAQTFTHMETSFQSTRHDYVEIDRWDWYFDTTGGTTQWTWYDDDAGTNTLLTFDKNGNLVLSGYLRSDTGLSINTAPSAGRVLDILGPSNADCELEVESGNSALYDVILALESENKWEFNSKHFSSGDNDGRLIIRNDTAATDFMTFSDVNSNIVAEVDFVGNGDIEATAGDVKNQDGTLVVPFPSCIVGLSLAQTVTTSDAVIPLTAINVDGSGSEYTISTVSNNITFDNADGNKIYEVSFYCRYDLDNQATTGATRSYAIATPRINSTAQTDYEEWTYIREFQGGTNGIPNNGSGMTLQIQPALNDVLDFAVRGVTDGGQTLTDFEIDAIIVTIKRMA